MKITCLARIALFSPLSAASLLFFLCYPCVPAALARPIDEVRIQGWTSDQVEIKIGRPMTDPDHGGGGPHGTK